MRRAILRQACVCLSRRISRASLRLRYAHEEALNPRLAKAMNIDRRMMQEADALGLTVEDLKHLKKDAADLEEVERSGIELCELRMRQRGCSEESIEKKKVEMNQKIKEILQLS